MTPINVTPPEILGGEPWRGRSVLSSHMWVANEDIANPAAILNAAVLTSTNPSTGDVTQITLAEQHEHHIAIAPSLFSAAEWDDRLPNGYEILDFSGNWVRHRFRDGITPKDDAQHAAWGALEYADGGVLNLACGKGKTVLALKKLAERGYATLVIVNNEGLIEMWAESAANFLGLPPEQIGIVQRDRAEWDRPLVIAMIHTLAKKAGTGAIPDSARMRFGTVIFDEVHHLSAQTFLQTAPLFFGNRYGLTATAEREDGLEEAYFAHIGRIFYTDLKGDLDSKVYFFQLDTRFPEDMSLIKDKRGQMSIGKLHTWLGEDRRRNYRILQVLRKPLEQGRKILVLTHGKEHPDILRELLLDQSWYAGYKVGVVHGKIKRGRTAIIRESDITFATFGVAREGLDSKELDTVVFATPFKAWGGFQQGKGRAERALEGKPEPVVVVFDDHKLGPAGGLCKQLRRSLSVRGIPFTITEKKA